MGLSFALSVFCDRKHNDQKSEKHKTALNLVQYCAIISLNSVWEESYGWRNNILRYIYIAARYAY